MTKFFLLAAMLFFVISTRFTPRADAGAIYYDFAGGMGKMQQSASFFGSTASSSTRSGVSLTNGIIVNLGAEKSWINLQLGVQHRLLTGSDSTYSYGLQTAYPLLRLQVSRFYLGFGYTPFVWRRFSKQEGFENYSRANSATAMLGEIGLLLPITRKFSFAVNYGMQFVSEGGTRSPAPAWDGTIAMRFYFGFFGPKGGERSSGEFHGWRYPFGRIP